MICCKGISLLDIAIISQESLSVASAPVDDGIEFKRDKRQRLSVLSYQKISLDLDDCILCTVIVALIMFSAATMEKLSGLSYTIQLLLLLVLAPP